MPCILKKPRTSPTPVKVAEAVATPQQSLPVKPLTPLQNEVEDLLFELKVSPAVFGLAVLLKAVEHKLIHAAASYLDEPELLDYYAIAGMRYLPMSHRGNLVPIAQDLHVTPEQLAAAVVLWFVKQRQHLGGFDVWIEDALRLTNSEYLTPGFRCQGCEGVFPKTSRKQRECSTCANHKEPPVHDTRGF